MAARAYTLVLCLVSLAATSQAIRGLSDDLINALAAEEEVAAKDVAAKDVAAKELKHAGGSLLHSEKASAQPALKEHAQEDRETDLLVADANFTRELRFQTDEHRAVGNAVKLSNGWVGSTKMTLDNGYKVTYGDLLSLCGDFYGKREIPISEGRTQEERERRFKESFACLEADPSDPQRIFGWDASDVKAAAETLSMPCTSYLYLAMYNFDHFVAMQGYSFDEQGGGGAWEAYSAGHAVACETAAQGRPSRRYLEKALMFNACASHYLSDTFAPGHMRNPRRFVPDLSSKWMHDEDNRVGLNVENRRGDKWRAYGDSCMADGRNVRGVTIGIQAVTASAEAVLRAWQTGDAATCKLDQPVVDLLPRWDLVQDFRAASGRGNSAPMFVVRNEAGVLQGKGKIPSGNSAYLRPNSCDMTDYGTYTDWDRVTTGTKLSTCAVRERAGDRFLKNVCSTA